MTNSIPSKLFQPVKVGNLLLSHRVVLCPLTRTRASMTGVPGDGAAEYYSQRSSTPGTLLIAEGTLLSQKAAGLAPIPGIWNDEQIRGWKRIVEVVHANQCFIYLQIWAVGRAARPEHLIWEDPILPYVSSSEIPLAGRNAPPRALTKEGIQEYLQMYATAASNAVDLAGFDGVEIHAANGYLIDQFTQDCCNKRTDEYGGSIENRCRFALEVLKSVTKVVGQSKTAIRLSPWGDYLEMGMEEPIPTFSYLIRKIAEDYPDLAYLHLVEPRASGDRPRVPKDGESNTPLREIWEPRPLIVAGGYTRELAIETADTTGNLIGFGRAFIANPDLPFRLFHDVPLGEGKREHYYVPGAQVEGYTDYPFSSQFLEHQQKLANPVETSDFSEKSESSKSPKVIRDNDVGVYA